MSYFSPSENIKKVEKETGISNVETKPSVRAAQPKPKPKKKSKKQELKEWYDEMGIIPPETR